MGSLLCCFKNDDWTPKKKSKYKFHSVKSPLRIYKIDNNSFISPSCSEEYLYCSEEETSEIAVSYNYENYTMNKNPYVIPNGISRNIYYDSVVVN